MTHRNVLFAFACVLAIPVCLLAERPNVVILYADDMGYGDLGVQNPDSIIPTPHLDRLAREGTRFTDAHSSSGICTPSIRNGSHNFARNWKTSERGTASTTLASASKVGRTLEVQTGCSCIRQNADLFKTSSATSNHTFVIKNARGSGFRRVFSHTANRQRRKQLRCSSPRRCPCDA